jgi:hypothetical protein
MANKIKSIQRSKVTIKNVTITKESSIDVENKHCIEIKRKTDQIACKSSLRIFTSRSGIKSKDNSKLPRLSS